MPKRPDAEQPARPPKRLHPDLTWPAPYTWVADDDPLVAVTGLAPFTADDGSVGLRNDEIDVLVTSDAEGALRVRIVPRDGEPYSVAEDVLAPGRSRSALDVHVSDERLVVTTEAASLELSYPTLRLELRDRAGMTLLSSRSIATAAGGSHGVRARFEFDNDPRAAILGLGGRTAAPDRQGTTADMFATKGYHLRGDYGGFPIPAFLSLGERPFGFVLINPQPHVYFDFGYSEPDIWSVDMPGGPVDLVVAAPRDPREWVAFLHALTGAPPLLRPQWFGTWFSYAGYSSSDEYLDWVERFEAEGIPLDVWVFDLHWRAGKVFDEDEGGDGVNLGWDPDKFASHRRLLAALAERQVDSLLHVNTRMYSGARAEEGARAGHLRDATEQQWIVDLDSEPSRAWAWTEYADRLDEGVTGWWIDNSERVEGILTSGVPARNYYSSQWNRYLSTRTREQTGESVVTLTRGGWLGDQVAALPWAGDTTAGVSRVREDLNFILNLAVTGFPFTSVDLGGFKEQKPSGLGVMDSDENVIRRIAHGFLFIPVPRLHSGVFTKPKLPWRYDGAAGEMLREFIRLRHRLAPYFFAAAVESCERAVPMVRPLAFDFPDDVVARGVNDEVLVGNALLVAPVIDEGWLERSVYLPEGRWFSYWTGDALRGGRSHLVDAPLTEMRGLPIFVREGGILTTREPGLPRDGFTTPKVSVYVADDSNDLAGIEIELGSVEGSRLRIARTPVSGGAFEMRFEALGPDDWTVDLDFPLTRGTVASASSGISVSTGRPVSIAVELRGVRR